MNSLVFLLLKSSKNAFLGVLRKPSKLIMYLLLIGLIAGVFALSSMNSDNGGEYMDIVWLKGILFLLLAMLGGMYIQKGVSGGDAVYDMNDVNLLFVSPVSPKSILIYGVTRTAKTSFLAGLFILFQGATLKATFGLGFEAVFILFLCFIAAMMTFSVLSLAIYSLTNGNPSKKRLTWFIAAAAVIPLATTVLFQYTRTGGIIPAIDAALRSPFFSWTPVAGWASEAAGALVSGDITAGLMFLGACAALIGLLLAYIALGKTDYYEDVLVATETAFERKRAVSEGNIQSAASGGRKRVSVGDTGIGGLGASALFYKHLRESARQNPLKILSTQSVLMIIGAAVMAMLIKSGDAGIMTILQVAMWIQIFFIGTGRGLKETYSHYIFMIPESSFTKIVWSNLETVFRCFIEAVPLFAVSGIILAESPFMIALCIAAYTLFSLLLLGVNYLLMRLSGIDVSAGLMLLIYTLAVMIIMLPGLVAAVAFGIYIGGTAGIYLGIGILAFWETAAALICFALSKGSLHNSDMPVFGQRK